MKRLLTGFFFIYFFISFDIKAQQNHFVYIQADNKQPFYVRLDKNVYSSTASGYIVLAKLKSGVHNLVFGFPKKEWPEQNIRCTIEDKDLGYLLKNFGEKGWGLFNLQSSVILLASENIKKSDFVKTIRTDAFSNMLSTVVNDPSIKEDEPLKQEIKKVAADETNAGVAGNLPYTKQAIKASGNEGGQTETLKAAKPSNEKLRISLKNDSADAKVNITKKLSYKGNEGLEMVYTDFTGGLKDTISILIPSETETMEIVAEKPETKSIPLDNGKAKQNESSHINIAEKKKDSKFLEIEFPNPNRKTNEIRDDSLIKYVASKSPMINSDCKNFATNEDFLKLRKKMAAEENPEDMVIISKKIFKTKCFTTEQLKNLSVLFLKDSGKYSFFDAAYPFVSDSQNYLLLEGQLTEPYYINRFRVMIKH
jgi:hypothetical protein